MEEEETIIFDNSNTCHLTESFPISEESVMTTLSEPQYIVTDVCDENMISLSVIPNIDANLVDSQGFNIEIEAVEENMECLSNTRCTVIEGSDENVSLLDSQNYIITTVEENATGSIAASGSYGCDIGKTVDENDLGSISQSQSIVIVNGNDLAPLTSGTQNVVSESMLTNLSDPQNLVTVLSDPQDIVTTLSDPQDTSLSDPQNVVATLSDPYPMVITLSEHSNLEAETTEKTDPSFSNPNCLVEDQDTNSQGIILPVTLDSQDPSLTDSKSLFIPISLMSQVTSVLDSQSIINLPETLKAHVTDSITCSKDGNISDQKVTDENVEDNRMQEAELIINLQTPRKRSGVEISGETKSAKSDAPSKVTDETVETLSIERREYHECYICKLKFRSITSLFKHRVAHNEQVQNTFKCDLCDRAFTDPNECTRHKLLHIEVRVFRCGICLESFSNEETFNYHARVHDCVGPYVCNICSQVFDKKQNYLTHHELHNPKTSLVSKNSLKCDVCGKVFAENHKLKRHLMYHNGERYHGCGVCKKTFVERSKLTRHMLTHTGKRDFSCSVCGKSFTLKFNLQQHLKIHQGIKSHECNVCGKTFTQRIVMQRHLKVHDVQIENY